VCVRTRNEQESETPVRNRVNETIRFDKLNDPILSAPTAVRSTAGSDEGVLFPAKWHLTKVGDMVHDNSGSCGNG
jgi:hypothetical protein